MVHIADHVYHLGFVRLAYDSNSFDSVSRINGKLRLDPDRIRIEDGMETLQQRVDELKSKTYDMMLYASFGDYIDHLVELTRAEHELYQSEAFQSKMKISLKPIIEKLRAEETN